MTNISWKTGSTGLWSDSADWSTGKVPGSSDSVTISVAPATSGTPYTVEIESAVAVSSITLDQSEAILDVSYTTLAVSTFTLTAGTLDIDYGSTFTVAKTFALAAAGTLQLNGSVLQGGTYTSTAGTVLLSNYATLSSLVWHGTLDLTTQNGGQVTLENVTFAGSAGTGNGTLAIGSGVTTYIDQAALSSVDVGLASGDYLYVETTTFTLASGSTLSTTGSTLTSGYLPTTVLDLESGGTLTNKGVITDASGANLTIDAGTLTNTGTISVSNGGTIEISTSGSTASTNSGLLSVGAGSYLDLYSSGGGGFTSTGSVSVAGTLGIDAALTSAELAKFTVATGTLALQGTLTNTAATVTVSSTAKLANLWLDGGEIIGGKIVSTGDFVATGGTLSGVTLDGLLSVSTQSGSYYETLVVTGSLTTTGAAGTGVGTLAISGAQVDFETGTTLTNLAVSLSTSTYGAAIEAGTGSETAGTTLTIGSGVHITTTGSNGSLLVATANDTLVNKGTITAGVQSGQLALEGLTNDGLISVTNGSNLYWYPNENSSASTTIVNAGTLSVDNSTVAVYLYSGSPYTLDNTGLISLTGTSTQFYYYEQMQFTNSGKIEVAGGATLDLGYSGETWSNSGTFLLSGGFISLGGTFTAAQIGKAVISDGGAIEIGGTLTNTGTISIGTGSTLTALTLNGGEIAGGTIHDAGSGLNFGEYGGTLSAVDYHGTINIASYDTALYVTGGLTMAGTTGSGTGTILVDGEYAYLRIIGSQTFNSTVIDIGDTSYTAYGNTIAFTDQTSTPSTLTLASTSSLVDVANADIDGNEIYNGTTYVPTGDTLINDGSITETASLSHLTTSFANLINAASISIENGSTFYVDGGTLTNQGTILISGADSSTGNTAILNFYEYYSDDFINTGLVTIGAGGDLDLNSGNLVWSNTGSFKVAGGQVELGGTITTGQLGKITVSAGGDVSIDSDGFLNNTSSSITVGGSSALGTIQLAGIIDSGSIYDDGNGIDYDGGSLENVRYVGVLAVSNASETASIIGSLHILSSTGASHATITVTGADAELDFTTTSTLTSVNVTIGNSIDPATLTGTDLFLASSDIIEQEGAYAAIGSFDGSIASTISNAGTIIAAQAGGSLGLFGDLANSGDIAVSNGATLYLDTSTLTNTGSISVTNGLLDIGDVTSNQLSEITLVNSQLVVTGVVTNTGSTLSVGTGTALPFIELNGTILGGTIHDAGGGIGIFGYAEMDGVTYEGTLELNRPLTDLVIVDGLTLTGSAGTGTGSIAITGAGSQLVWDSTQSLDNATISIGNPGESYEGTFVSTPAIVSDYYYTNSEVEGTYYNGSLTLGSKLTINQTGTYADVGGESAGGGYTITGTGIVTSAATINAGFAHGDMSFESGIFTNTGTINISSTDTLTEGAGTFTNAGLISIGAGSTLTLNLFNYFGDAIYTPYVLTNTGTILLAGGTITEPTDNGTFPSVPLLNSAAINGFGTIQSEITNDGTVTASGGTLTLGESVTGTGALAVDAGARLSLAAVSAGEIATFSGTGGILGLSPATFLGEIGGFASGDTIDLAGTSAKAASFSGTSLVVTLSTGSTIKLTTTTALTGTLKTTAGTHGDTLITFAGAAAHEPIVPSPIAPPLLPQAEPELTTSIAAASLFHPQTTVEIWPSNHMQ
jgi:hypothetical protein